MGGARLGFFVLKDTELRPLFCGDWHCLGGGGRSGWTLAADLLDDSAKLFLHNDSVVALLAG